jgi:tyrosyl-DNA phosphodiesterase 2
VASGHSSSSSFTVLAGDFNRISEEEDGWVLPPWHDVWLQLRPNDPGFTYDCEENQLAESYQSRLDKVLWTTRGDTSTEGGGSTVVPESISMVGCPAAPPPLPPVGRDGFVTTPPPVVREMPPSDHFGLLATFRL